MFHCSEFWQNSLVHQSPAIKGLKFIGLHLHRMLPVTIRRPQAQIMFEKHKSISWIQAIQLLHLRGVHQLVDKQTLEIQPCFGSSLREKNADMPRFTRMWQSDAHRPAGEEHKPWHAPEKVHMIPIQIWKNRT